MALNTFPATLVTGPRQSGKTTLLKERFGHRHRFISLEDPDLRRLIEEDRRPGQWLLSRSQSFSWIPDVSQSLSGRVAVLSLLPLSLGTRTELQLLTLKTFTARFA